MSYPYPPIDHFDHTRPRNNWTANTVRQWLAVSTTMYKHMYRQMTSLMIEARIFREILRTHVQRRRRTQVETVFCGEPSRGIEGAAGGQEELGHSRVKHSRES